MKCTYPIIFFLLLFSCKKENQNPSDAAFEIGTFDSYDQHVVLDPPVLLDGDELNEFFEIDLNNDERIDLFFRHAFSGSAGGLRTYSVYIEGNGSGNNWEIAGSTAIDSVFVCRDSVLPTYPGNSCTYYSRHRNYNCSRDTDVFYRVDHYKVPSRFTALTPISAVNNWTYLKKSPDPVHYFYYGDMSSNPQYCAKNITLGYYEGFQDVHYIALRKAIISGFQHAWIKVKFDYENLNLTILEYATQAEFKQ